MKTAASLALLLFGSFLMYSCGSDKPEPDRGFTDTTGRGCTWCADGSCALACDPPGSACSNHDQEWTFKARDVLHFCQACPTSVPEQIEATDCHPLVCSASVDCFVTGWKCAGGRCLWPCVVDADCIDDDVSCTEGRCVYPE